MKYHLKTLKNKLRILTIPQKDAQTVTAMVLVSTGSKYETPANNGISHFLEHMCFKGTTKRPTPQHITRELDSLGVQYNAFTSHEYTGYYIKGAAKHFDHILEIISDIYLHSTFPAEEMNRERGVITDEINMYEDLPQKKIDDVFMHLAYGDQPAGRSILGPKKNIQDFTRDTFVKYHKEHYVASGTLVVVSGGVESKKAIALSEKLFGVVSTAKKHAKKKVVEAQKAPAVLCENKKTDQTHIMLGYRTFKKTHPKTLTASFIGAILGAGMSSRLFDRVREQMGVGYYVYAYNDTYTDHGALKIGTGVANDRVAEVVKALHQECMRLVNEKVTAEELKKVKDYLIGNMYLGLETTDAWSDFYGMPAILNAPIMSPKEREKQILSVTATQIQSLAKQIFVPKNANLALIGQYSDAKVLEQILR